MPAKTTCFNVLVHTSCMSLLISPYLLQMYVIVDREYKGCQVQQVQVQQVYCISMNCTKT